MTAVMTLLRVDETSDAELAAAIGARDHEALAEAYRRHAGSVFGQARRFFSDRERAADTTQDVFIRLWEDPRRYNPDRASLRTFLLMDTRGRSIDRVRADARRRARDTRYSRDELQTANLDSEIETDIVVAQSVRDALDSLPVTERAAIECAYFGGHTYQQAAVILACPEGTIKSRIRNGLRRLAQSLDEFGIDPRHDRDASPPKPDGHLSSVRSIVRTTSTSSTRPSERTSAQEPEPAAPRLARLPTCV